MRNRVYILTGVLLVLIAGVAVNYGASQAATGWPGLTHEEMLVSVGACCGVGTLDANACAHAWVGCTQAWVYVLEIPIPYGCANTTWDGGCNNESSVTSNGNGGSVVTTINCSGKYDIGSCASILNICYAQAAAPQNRGLTCGTRNIATGC